MRQKSKQQAKIEATQKLEQVKNEQQQQQFGSHHHLSQSGSDTPNSGNQSPLTPQNSGNMSPVQQTFNKDAFTKQTLSGAPASFSDDVFLKPQAPPPTPTRTHLQDPLQSSQPHSPQMFSPGSSNSRPSSPFDPYAKMVGTPRPPPASQNFHRKNCGSPMDICLPRHIPGSESSDARPSPIRDSCSSPSSSDPSLKMGDVQKNIVPADPFSKPLGLSRLSHNTDQMIDGSLGPVNSDSFTKHSSRSEIYQRPQIPTKVDPYSRPPLTPTSGVSPGSPAPFKTPLRPPQSPQESYNLLPTTPRRISTDPYERHVLTPRPAETFSHDPYNQAPHGNRTMNEPFANPPRLMRQHSDPQSASLSRSNVQDPYAQPPGTPRPTNNPYLKSPTASRPTAVDPYLQQPPTPRPPVQAMDPYSQPPSTPRPVMGDVFVQPSMNKRHHDSFAASPIRNSMDPYSQQPGTPRPAPSDSYVQLSNTPRPVPLDPYSQPPATPRPVSSDIYAQSPGTPRPVPSDPYAQPPATPRPPPLDPYSQPPGTPRPAPSDLYGQPPATPRPGPSDQYSQPPATPRPLSSDSYALPPGTPRPMPLDPYSQPPSTPQPVLADPYSQPPGTPRPLPTDSFSQPNRTPRHVFSDPYAQPPRTPMPSGPENFNRSSVVRSVLISNQESFLQNTQSRGAPFSRISEGNSQNSRLTGPSPVDLFSHTSSGPNQEPYDQPPGAPHIQTGEGFGDPHDIGDQQRTFTEETFSGSSNIAASPQGQQFGNMPQLPGLSDAQNSLNLPMAESEEKARQRQKLREMLLRQQQTKNAVRHEKVLDPLQMTQGAHPTQWQQESPHRQNEVFNRPPPPYPGNIRASIGHNGNPRFSALPKEQRPPFLGNAQFNRPPFTGDINIAMRPPPDFDAITDPIMKAKMVALKGINKVMVNTMGMSPMVINRFPFVGQQAPGTPLMEAQNVAPPPVPQDGNIAPQMIRPNPPNFGPGFVNDSQKKQYEEWLQETQQLLQIQQKFLEEQIGAHRKSKKALSAKQRTAKKAGREFPEEDAEQLKHVTEQQSMVQKQLETIRKQQKEHTELIEEYRNKQQQFSVAPLMPGVLPQQALMTGGPPPPINQPNFQIPQALHPPGPTMPGQPSQPRMPGWQPPHAPRSLAHPPRMQRPTGSEVAGPAAHENPNAPPRVEFDDNNPFSETFQERERKERLREQQERQRIQLMQEVDRQRAIKQRIEIEQQGMVGPDLNNRPLSQMPFFASELPNDFMSVPQPLQQSPQHQAQMGHVMPHQSMGNSPPTVPFIQSSGKRSLGLSPYGQESQTGFPQASSQPTFMPNVTSASPVADSGRSIGQDRPVSATGFQSPNQSLIQLYSEIIPEEKGKKKRPRKKKKEEDADSLKSPPSTPRSDTTAPLTPSISEASTPTVTVPNNDSYREHVADLIRSSTPNTVNSNSVELEDPLVTKDLKGAFEKPRVEEDNGQADSKVERNIQEIKLENTEGDQSPQQADPKVKNSSVSLKTEEATLHSAVLMETGSYPASGPSGKLESGNELLKHLLKNKKQPVMLQQKSEESLQSDECPVDVKSAGKQADALHPSESKELVNFNINQNLLSRTDFDMERKKPRNKRVQRNTEKAAVPRSKKRKKEEEQKPPIFASSETFTHIKQQLSLLPLIEPIVGMNFAQFLPYGTGPISAGSRLLGTFGCASLDGVSDYYSQLIFKQNNLSNPPTPPASLPPTPPPVACQKMVNGYATTEELAGKAAILGGHVTKALGPKQFHLPFRSQDDLLARAITQGPKSVDVPASLPTPPHNNQEELRVQDHCDARDSPDSFVPSSSPESVVGMEISRYPDLSLVKEEPPDPAPSPIIPILPSSTGKGSEARDNCMKREPGTLFFGSHFNHASNGPKPDLISVAITLHPTAAENISGVVSAFADLLQVHIPTSYEVSSAPDSASVILMNGHSMHSNMEYRHQLLRHRSRPGIIPPARLIGPYAMKAHHLPFMPNNGMPGYRHHPPSLGDSAVLRPSWCCHCKVVVLGSGVRKSMKDLRFLKREFLPSPGQMDGELVFCSNNCFLLYSAAQAKCSENKNQDRSLTLPLLKEPQLKSCHQYSNNTSTLDVHCLPLLQEKASPPSSPPISFPPAAFETAKVEAKPDELKVTVKLKPRPRAVHSGFDDSRPVSKKWRGMKWKKWNIQIVIPKMPFKSQCEDDIDEFLKKLGTSLKPDPMPKDFRKCCFCHEEGDGMTDGPARLLNLDLDLWVHLNCALWSTEVYETQAGALINVELALRRGLQMKCVFCHKMGATSGCHRLRCTNIYHFTCAIKAQCMFFKDKTMLCPMHKPKGAHEQELTYFAVFRRVYVQRDEVRQIASIVQRGERDHTFRVGSLIFHAIGQLLPQQMLDFHSATALFPVGYEASRLYWSMRYANRRCRYHCYIEENDGLPLFFIRVNEQGHEDLILTDSTPKGVWDKILEPVANCRKNSEILRLFPIYLKGEDLFGLTVSAVTRIAESVCFTKEVLIIISLNAVNLY
ncbi:hypothetical protein AB205_0091220 [Aquarana catesbeiana]|uniref:[histone H3]-lysine(4) N-methyltransferase n=1 Tax=Aquarana catesbeiana TaxID=8400 RepID=A0A2G9SIX3_AQUCT|nr:hypothetical protein AB205_0091220 [Aquarana catesbeiana]